MRTHCSSRQSVTSVDDVGAAEHGDPEIRLVGESVTPAHSATTNTLPLRRVNLLFLVSSLAKRRLVLPTGYSLCFNVILGLVSASLFLANALVLLPSCTLFSGLELSALFYPKTFDFMNHPSILLRSDCS
ncbi:hypothetical protein PR001_g29522 [Phytophthora rubi]|uniref:Uncharacterized protein n=1 Tax=Phytophthora rubi TaxID=129364 RepID=A0A6A3H0M5_9STRA|nr:hypothetical protein PR001_g29522 [Phytophthora rubi]